MEQPNTQTNTGNDTQLILYSQKDYKENIYINNIQKLTNFTNNSNSTGPLNLIQRQIVTSKTVNTGNTSYFNYQNYLQQYQHQLVDNRGSSHNSSPNCNKINAKLKIVQMRNRHESLGKTKKSNILASVVV
jgi:hypothetical protein